MKIRLKEGKQEELILLAKGNKTWRELGNLANVNQLYLSGDLRRETILLSDELFDNLCKIAGVNFNEFIINKLENYWGRKLGGINSSRFSKGSLKEIKKPENSQDLAEFIGAVLGDGHVMYYKKGKKTACYQINITGHLLHDKEYHVTYLKNLCKKLFDIDMKESIHINTNCRHIIGNSREMVRFFMNMGIKPGDKIRNQSTIPLWIWENNNWLKACLRGLIDTDGSIFRMSNQDPQLLRINFVNHNKTLLEDTRKVFVKLGFNPSKIINDRQINLSRKSDISKYLKEIGFS